VLELLTPDRGGDEVGQRVVVEPNYPCLRCPACRSGLTSMCPDRVLVGFTAPGLLAEYAAVPSAYAWPVPGRWSDGDAVCVEPLTVAMAAMRAISRSTAMTMLLRGEPRARRTPISRVRCSVE